MKRLLLTFDVEEFDWPVERGHALDAVVQMDVTSRGLDLVLPLLAKHRTRATFFVTATYARAQPERVRALAEAGHEVASHGLGHQDDYGRMDESEARARLTEARRVVEDTTGGPVYGIRTPHLLPCPPARLLEAGFSYDASAHPTWVPSRYNGLRRPRVPWFEDGLLRIPISVLPAIRLPVSFLWYRAAGPRLGPIAARLAAPAARTCTCTSTHGRRSTSVRSASRAGSPCVPALRSSTPSIVSWPAPSPGSKRRRWRSSPAR